MGGRLKALFRVDVGAEFLNLATEKKQKYCPHLAALSKRASRPTLASTPLPTTFKGGLWSPVQLDEAAYSTVFVMCRADNTV